MRKIPTIFERDESAPGHPVTDRVKPECQWVLDGEGVPTRKLDGTNVKVEGGKLYKRQKPKERDYDDAAYVEARRDDPADRYIFEAFDHSRPTVDGIYEALGPKIQSNPERRLQHELVLVCPPCGLVQMETADLDHLVRTFDGLRRYLADNRYEGIVFHHPDGRMAKIKRRDFGMPWPVR